ncbi:MAG: hypothetical protein ACRENG_14090 [bacterium]
MRRLLWLIMLSFTVSTAEADYLYKAIFVRAAPGKLLDLIALYKERMPVYDASGDLRPFWMRHSQGDQRDLMFLFPMESYSEYFKPERIDKRNKAAERSGLPQKDFAKKFYELVAWHEEIFVKGPALEQVQKAFSGAGFFHVEIFLALPGKQAALYHEREMENAYLKALARPENLIFTHDQGAAWDLFTIGCYRDLKHYAESADIPDEKEEQAARAAGFEGADKIGTYLRTLIQLHHDTLAVTVK